jgi:hypothetical protein
MIDINKLELGYFTHDWRNSYGIFHCKKAPFTSLEYMYLPYHVVRYVSVDYIITSSRYVNIEVSLVVNPG